MTKPRLFIGSSVETLPVAQVLQRELQHDALVQLWTQGIFGLSNYTLEALLAATKEFDFAAFVFGTDDMVEIRGKHVLTARDNVVFELGLFVGQLGCDRTFIVVQRSSEELHLPSDLQGVTPTKFAWPQNTPFDLKDLPAVMGPAAHDIRTAMAGRGVDDAWIKPLSGGMVFVALCLHDRSYTVNELGQPFRRFQKTSRRMSSGDAEVVYSVIAAKYACQCLEALGLAESFGGNEYSLTKLGRELLESGKLRDRHRPTYDAFQRVMTKRPARNSSA